MLIEAMLVDVFATLIGPDRAYIEEMLRHVLIWAGWAILLLATPVAILLNIAGSLAWHTRPRRRKHR
jgi:hypothetical protein